jgi:hypothetical protein
VATVERADPNGEGQVVGSLVWCQLEVLGCDTPDAHPACGDFRRGESLDHGNTLGRSIDHQHVPITDPLNHGSCRGARRTSNLEDAHAWS